jgi:Bifunctional DNA primase/polymerase, N-terminal/Primase C terminal 1 (PriCT-1)
MSGIFSRWQPRYAEHGIATFPVRIEGKDKRPLSKGYQRTGIRGSAALASKFTQADAFGLMLGAHNKIEIVDVDTKDERALSDALSTYGNSPVVSRTASGGGFHVWYRHSPEAWKHYPAARREVRPDPSKPFDFLAAGMMVAPPSIGPLGQYEFIEGGLDNLGRLKPLASPVPPRRLPDGSEAVLLPSLPVARGTRNNRAWRFAMQTAKAATSFEQLLGDVAAFNQRCEPPMEKEEVMSVCESAWRYTQNNQNRFGQHGAYFPTDEVVSMLRDQDALVLLAFLRAKQGPWSTFMVANGLTEVLGWRRHRLAAARTRLIEMNYIAPVRQAGKGVPAVYKSAE